MTDLDRAIDACVARFARAGSIDGAEFLAALRCTPGAVTHDGGGELVDRERSAWLCEQILQRLVAKLDAGLAESELDADVKSAIATELRGVFDRVLTIADQRFGEC